MYTFECVHSIITPPPSLSVKFAKNPHKPNASHAKPFFSKVFRYLGVDLKKKNKFDRIIGGKGECMYEHLNHPPPLPVKLAKNSCKPNASHASPSDT